MVCAWCEDPAGVDVGVQRELKDGEFGHGRERVPECAIERTEDMSGGVHRDGEGAHDTGNGRIVGESDDDRKIVVSRGEDEIAVEDALHDGTEEGMGAAECGEVGRTEVGGDAVVELDGETRERHGGVGEHREETRGRVFKNKVYALSSLCSMRSLSLPRIYARLFHRPSNGSSLFVLTQLTHPLTRTSPWI